MDFNYGNILIGVNDQKIWFLVILCDQDYFLIRKDNCTCRKFDKIVPDTDDEIFNVVYKYLFNDYYECVENYMNIRGLPKVLKLKNTYKVESE